MPTREDHVRCAIVGYGPTFNFGWVHARWIEAAHDLRLVAICDSDPQCASKARVDFPDVDVYTDVGEMLRRDDIDLVSVVTQHNTHAEPSGRDESRPISWASTVS